MSKEQIFAYTYDVLPADWVKFKNMFIKQPNVLLGVTEDEVGDFEYLYDKASSTLIGKWYSDELEFVTDIPKVDFYKFQRGQKVDIWQYIK